MTSLNRRPASGAAVPRTRGTKLMPNGATGGISTATGAEAMPAGDVTHVVDAMLTP